MCLPRRGKIREEICTVASGPQRRKAHVELTPEVRADRPTWVLCLGGENRAVLNAYHTPWPHRASSNPAHLTKELQCHAAPCHVVCVCGGVDGALSTCILNTSGRVLCGSAHAPGRAARSCLTYRRRLKHCSHLSMATWWQRFDVRASGIMSSIERCHRTF